MVSGNSLFVQKITGDFWKKADDANNLHVKIMLPNATKEKSVRNMNGKKLT